MSICPSCGSHEFDPAKQCVCGYQTGNIATHSNTPVNAVHAATGAIRDEAYDHTDKTVIMEIDSWQFTCSDDDNTIFLSTQALKPFSIRLKVKDLEDMLEFIYSRRVLKKKHLKIDSLPRLSRGGKV